MTVRKNGNDVGYLARLRDAANKGCDKCPNCGETRTLAESVSEFRKGLSPIIGGISSGLCSTWTEDKFWFSFILWILMPWRKSSEFLKHMKIDWYHCRTCGSEWQSDPYQTSL